MHWPLLIRGIIGVLILTSVTPLRAEVTTAQVNDAIDRGIKFLRSRQDREGRWARGAQKQWEGGDSALVALALLNSGVPLDDPMLQKAMVYVRNMKTRWNYAVSLQTMVLCQAEPTRDTLAIRENVRWLERTQISKGSGRGGWGYGRGKEGADPSNSQFSMLALYEAEQVGINVKERTWRLALNYWKNQQLSNGSWGYRSSEGLGSMTCAGIGSMIIASGQIGKLDAKLQNGTVLFDNYYKFWHKNLRK